MPRPSSRRGRGIASKEDVLDAIENGAGCVVNALTPEQHRGEVAPYGRPGHIAASVNVSARDLVDRETGAYLPLDVLRERCQEAGTLSAGRVITYCGGGIAATSTAFVLTLLGKDDVAVYDASLSEWARDESLPMEVGA
jgi:thiosulfate/3-mercaptopyruvate sulfurtransferase